jgi:hypothetical protein
MKKVILLFAALMTGGLLMAQMPNFGIRAGLTTSKLTTNLSENFASDNRLGYQGGAFVRLNFGKLYVQPELIYNHRSTKLEYEINPVIDGESQRVGVRSDLKIGTFDIPVLVGFKLVKTKLFNLRFFAGPDISFSTNKDVSYEYTTGDGEDFQGDIPDEGKISVDDFNSTTWYLQAGAGVDVLFLTLDVRYEKGLSDLYNDGNLNFKNNVWLVTLGFKFL